jgi:hypothetical protein
VSDGELLCKCMDPRCTDRHYADVLAEQKATRQDLKMLPSNAVLRQDTLRLLSHFDWGHLPPVLAAISRPFAELAEHLVATLGESPDTTKALNDLLAAKDWAVRARLPLER